jgi:ribA/ribD-fused uncharacterized protein
MCEEIRFTYTDSTYGFLCNFYKTTFIAEGIKWKTSEHYYQYKKMKFLQDLGEPISDELLQDIINASTPKRSKELGHIKVNQIDKWDEIKVSAMEDVLRMKFKKKFIRQCLINTGDAILIEKSYYDEFWAEGKNGNGKNMLGISLMKIRDEVKRDEHDN